MVKLRPKRNKRRRRVTLSANIDPAVARAFKRVCFRRGNRVGIAVERIIVCYLLSDGWGRSDCITAGQFKPGETIAERRQRLIKFLKEREADMAKPWRKKDRGKQW